MASFCLFVFVSLRIVRGMHYSLFMMILGNCLGRELVRRRQERKSLNKTAGYFERERGVSLTYVQPHIAPYERGDGLSRRKVR